MGGIPSGTGSQATSVGVARVDVHRCRDDEQLTGYTERRYVFTNQESSKYELLTIPPVSDTQGTFDAVETVEAVGRVLDGIVLISHYVTGRYDVVADSFRL